MSIIDDIKCYDCDKTFPTTCYFEVGEGAQTREDRLGVYVSNTPNTAFGLDDWNLVFNGTGSVNQGIAWATADGAISVTFTVALNAGEYLGAFRLRGMVGSSPAEAFDTVNSVSITGLSGTFSGGSQAESGPNGATAFEYTQVGYYAASSETVTVVMELERTSLAAGNQGGSELDQITPIVTTAFETTSCQLLTRNIDRTFSKCDEPFTGIVLGNCEPCPPVIQRCVTKSLADLTPGVDAGLFGVFTDLAEGTTSDDLPTIETIRAWKEANLDYNSVTTTVQGNLNVPDQAIVGSTVVGFIEFFMDESVPTDISWSFAGEGFICIETDTCGCGDYETVAEAFGPLSHSGTGVVNYTVPAEPTLVRVTQIDIEGSNNLWVPDAATAALTVGAPSSGSLFEELIDLKLDCEGNYTNLDGSPVVGTIEAPKGLCDLKVKVENVVGLNLPVTIAGLTQTREIANASLDVQDMNVAGTVSWTAALSEGQWSSAANVFTYAGTSDYIVINAKAHQAISQNANIQRTSSVLELQRSINGGADWETVDTGASGYIRDNADHEESSNSVFYRDINPPAGVQYRLVKRQEALAGIVDLVTGQFDLEAVTNI